MAFVVALAVRFANVARAFVPTSHLELKAVNPLTRLYTNSNSRNVSYPMFKPALRLWQATALTADSLKSGLPQKWFVEPVFGVSEQWAEDSDAASFNEHAGRVSFRY